MTYEHIQKGWSLASVGGSIRRSRNDFSPEVTVSEDVANTILSSSLQLPIFKPVTPKGKSSRKCTSTLRREELKLLPASWKRGSSRWPERWMRISFAARFCSACGAISTFLNVTRMLTRHGVGMGPKKNLPHKTARPYLTYGTFKASPQLMGTLIW